ncbi:MAG: hypothetical protein R1F54_01725 [Candidatus Zeuxoniibacter abyssi]|nr:MAG: hypothetical protein R1F54_01725 [Candidatus Persebacteraceae bacterium AB1(2)]
MFRIINLLLAISLAISPVQAAPVSPAPIGAPDTTCAPPLSSAAKCVGLMSEVHGKLTYYPVVD